MIVNYLMEISIQVQYLLMLNHVIGNWLVWNLYNQLMKIKLIFHQNFYQLVNVMNHQKKAEIIKSTNYFNK